MFHYLQYILLGLLLSLKAFAIEPAININKFLEQDIPESGNVSYFQVTPQYEENLDPKRAVTLEFYFAEFTGTEKDKETLKQIRRIIDQDKIDINGIGLAYDTDELTKSDDVKTIKKLLKIKDENYELEEVPSFVKSSSRNPSSLKDSITKPRVYWSLVRGFANLGGAAAVSMISFGVSPHVAISANLLFGLGSGASTYFNNVLDQWMNRGLAAKHISKWLLTGKGLVARNLRKSLKLNALSIEESIINHTNYLKTKYPVLYANNPQIFEKLTEKRKMQAIRKSKTRMGMLVNTFIDAEMYLKWAITEVFAVSVLLELPKSIAGVSAFSSLEDAAKGIVVGTGAAIVSQAPAEFAILKDKYKQFRKLKQNVLDGKIEVKDRKNLLTEIEKILATDGEFKNYTVRDDSHALLQRIETKARAKGAIVSVLAMTGVAMQLSQMPIAKYYIGAISGAGALYFIHVQGWIPYKHIQANKTYQKLSNKIQRVAAPVRYCSKMLVP